MSDPLTPIARILPERRLQVRRCEDRDDSADQSAPESADGAVSPDPPVLQARPAAPPGPDPHDPLDPSAAFVAQVLGQPGQKRGLRGGPETLERARSAYLDAEYSGASDRRLPPGVAAKTEI